MSQNLDDETDDLNVKCRKYIKATIHAKTESQF